MTHCDKMTAHNAHGSGRNRCEGRDRCAVCRTLGWVDEMVVITEHRAHNGRRRHRRCRF